jgi:Sigma-70, region 4
MNLLRPSALVLIQPYSLERRSRVAASSSGRCVSGRGVWLAGDGQPRSLAAVGETLGVSRERARQLESAALSELRERQRELGLEGLAA